jgi:hypothetical protein
VVLAPFGLLHLKETDWTIGMLFLKLAEREDVFMRLMKILSFTATAFIKRTVKEEIQVMAVTLEKESKN